MPSLSVYKRYLNAQDNGGNTVGRFLKEHSDFVMEETWDSDIQSKKAYIYDYYHDDQPELNRGMTYENTTKTPIDIKFIINEYGSAAKDSPTAKIMFKPSQKVDFDVDDELYYFQTDYYDRWSVRFPISLYIDIPDEKGVYNKWMIIMADIQGNQFPKYFVLPCTYRLEWIRRDGNKRIKQRMWVVIRSQNSYNSGLWLDRYITTRENQDRIFMPLNDISETLWYLSDDNEANQRIIVDVRTERPNVWQVSKVERVNPIGLKRVTIYQTEFNPHTDYVEKDNDGKIIGMWADYFSSGIEPVIEENSSGDDISCELTASNNQIKIGGSYKTITAKFFEGVIDVTGDYSLTADNWHCFIDGADVTDLLSITTLDNKLKVKFPNDMSYLTKVLTVQCTVGDIVGEINFDIIAV